MVWRDSPTGVAERGMYGKGSPRNLGGLVVSAPRGAVAQARRERRFDGVAGSESGSARVVLRLDRRQRRRDSDGAKGDLELSEVESRPSGPYHVNREMVRPSRPGRRPETPLRRTRTLVQWREPMKCAAG